MCLAFRLYFVVLSFPKAVCRFFSEIILRPPSFDFAIIFSGAFWTRLAIWISKARYLFCKDKRDYSGICMVLENFNWLYLLIQRATEKVVSRSVFVHLTQRPRIRIALNFSCRLVPFIALFEKKSGFQMPPNPFFPIFSL